MSSIWNTSLNILAQREHSRAELRNKLIAKFPEQDQDIDAILDRLAAQHLQSDQRYAEMWLRSGISKGWGPVRIIAEACHKGIELQVSDLLSESNLDWFEQALTVCRRKFNYRLCVEDKPKAYRFLSYRGFSADAIQYAIESHLSESM
ncbi:MAG: regulatory protein RecX [Reinekea sp.]